MSTAAAPDPGFEVVVSDDGGIPAEQLARFGMNRPGIHLRLVPEPEVKKPRRTSWGILKDKIDPEVANEIEEALRQNKEERIAAIERDEVR